MSAIISYITLVPAAGGGWWYLALFPAAAALVLGALWLFSRIIK